jgi:hypothetical protein
VGSTFVPDEGSIGIYEAIGSVFRHKGSNYREISGRCNVTNPLDDGASPGDWDTMQVVYFNQNETNQITAELKYVSNDTGGEDLIAKFDSKNFAISPLHPELNLIATVPIPLGGKVFNFSVFAFYVQIRLSRTQANATAGNRPAIAVVRLMLGGPD